MKLLTFFLTLASMNLIAQPLNDPSTWQGVTDQVMGGVSNLSIRHSDGVFFMTGNVSTDNNGGFVRLSNRVDISSNDFQGIKKSTLYPIIISKYLATPKVTLNVKKTPKTAPAKPNWDTKNQYKKIDDMPDIIVTRGINLVCL